MTLEQVKGFISMGAFSPDVHDKMTAIMDAAITRGEITADEQATLLELVDVETEAVDIEAEALETSAVALEEFANESDIALAEYAKELQEVEAEFDAEIHRIAPDMILTGESF